MSDTLLIELLTEELPPKALALLGQSFADTILAELQRLQLVAADVDAQVFASPRRLAVRVPQVLAEQPEQAIERRGPAVAAGMKDGAPTPALAGFARSCGVAVDALETGHDGKQDVYIYRASKAGEALAALLPDVLALAVKKLPIPKVMHWADSDVQFVRPVHALTVLHGAHIVPVTVLALAAGRASRGHRFLSSGAIEFAHADDYAKVLFEGGKVIASFAARREKIKHDLDAAAAKLNATLAAGDALLDEVTGLVEWPVVYTGQFDPDFLCVPQECLILTMQQNQKYFPLLDGTGKLLPTFLLVSNLATDDPSHVIHGNERVLRARLSDAQFFYQQDQKTKLESRVPKLANVVYHNQIGSQLERVLRLQTIAGKIAALLGADVTQTERAAYLAKADLLTDMVGEFPELQGVMGRYYAQQDGEATEVADALAGHYCPRFAGDDLPVGPIATAVALADKLETLIGIYGIGLVPTGDKDPFALRRAALGVLRILVEGRLAVDLPTLLQQVAATFSMGQLSATVDVDVHAFMTERLRYYLALSHDTRDVDAVLALRPGCLNEVTTQLAAVAEFRALPDAAALIAANKRIRNILKKTDYKPGAINRDLLQEPAEQSLAAALAVRAPQVDQLVVGRDYIGALRVMAGLRTLVDGFFDGVMVMADDDRVRQNRLALLTELSRLLNRVADISLLAE